MKKQTILRENTIYIVSLAIIGSNQAIWHIKSYP